MVAVRRLSDACARSWIRRSLFVAAVLSHGANKAVGPKIYAFQLFEFGVIGSTISVKAGWSWRAFVMQHRASPTALESKRKREAAIPSGFLLWPPLSYFWCRNVL
jgi:hypothetical protein